MPMRRFRLVEALAHYVNESEHRQNKTDHKKHLMKRNAHPYRESDHHGNPDRFEEIRHFHNSSF